MDLRHDLYQLHEGANQVENGESAVVNGFDFVAIQLQGAFSATLTFEATIDGANWVAIEATNLADGTSATTASAEGIFRIDCRGLVLVRARISSYVSGSINALANVTK